MGKLIYGTMRQEIELDDRVLAHVQAVTATKLRRGEGFFLTWRDEGSMGNGHSSAWMAPNIPLFFKYFGSKHVPLDRQLLETMTVAAGSNAGLVLGEEASLASVLPITAAG